MKHHLLCLLFALIATAASCAPTAWDYCWTQMEPEAFGKPDMWDISGSQELLEFQATLLALGLAALSLRRLRNHLKIEDRQLKIDD